MIPILNIVLSVNHRRRNGETISTVKLDFTKTKKLPTGDFGQENLLSFQNAEKIYARKGKHAATSEEERIGQKKRLKR